MTVHEEQVRDFKAALLTIDRIKATVIFDDCFHQDHGFLPIERLVVTSLESIGDDWEKGAVSLSQVYMSGRLCEDLVEAYLPKTDTKRKGIPRMAIAILRDHHALGKRIVYALLRASGYEVLDFGQGLDSEEIVERTIRERVEILMISTLMLSSALRVREVREKLDEACYPASIIVGGAPFRLDAGLWKSVGADAGARTASDVFELLEKALSA
jgi:methanogenic corrinoid protein MtbC1